MHFGGLRVIVVSVCLLGCGAIVFADTVGQPATDAQAPSAKQDSEKKPQPPSPTAEHSALEFAKTHHPELSRLLGRLKKNNRQQYNEAVAELFKTSEQLARQQERDPERYLLSLEIWKLDSRIRLLAARIAVEENSKLEEELKQKLRKRQEYRVQQLSLDRDRLQSRAVRLNQQIETILADPESAAMKDFKRLQQSIGIYTEQKKRKPRNPRPETESNSTSPGKKRSRS